MFFHVGLYASSSQNSWWDLLKVILVAVHKRFHKMKILNWNSQMYSLQTPQLAWINSRIFCCLKYTALISRLMYNVLVRMPRDNDEQSFAWLTPEWYVEFYTVPQRIHCPGHCFHINYIRGWNEITVLSSHKRKYFWQNKLIQKSQKKHKQLRFSTVLWLQLLVT